MQNSVKFHRKIKRVSLGDKTIIIENLTPVLPPKERARRKREIERRLFDVFSKHMDTSLK